MAPNLSRKRPSPTSTDIEGGFVRAAHVAQQGLASQLLELIEMKTSTNVRIHQFTGAGKDVSTQNGSAGSQPSPNQAFAALTAPQWDTSWIRSGGDGDLIDVILAAKGERERAVVSLGSEGAEIGANVHLPSGMLSGFSVQDRVANEVLGANLADGGALDNLHEMMLKNDSEFELPPELEVDQQWQGHGSGNFLPFGLDLTADPENVNLEIAQLLHEVDVSMPTANSPLQMPLVYPRVGVQQRQAGPAPGSLSSFHAPQSPRDRHRMHLPSQDVQTGVSTSTSGESTAGSSGHEQDSRSNGPAFSPGRRTQPVMLEMPASQCSPLAQSPQAHTDRPFHISKAEQSMNLGQQLVSSRLSPTEQSVRSSSARAPDGLQPSLPSQQFFQSGAQPAQSGTSRASRHEAEQVAIEPSQQFDAGGAYDSVRLGSSKGLSVGGSVQQFENEGLPGRAEPDIFRPVGGSLTLAEQYRHVPPRFEGDLWDRGSGGMDGRVPGGMPVGHATGTGLQRGAASLEQDLKPIDMQAGATAYVGSVSRLHGSISPQGSGNFQAQLLQHGSAVNSGMAQARSGAAGLAAPVPAPYPERIVGGGCDTHEQIGASSSHDHDQDSKGATPGDPNWTDEGLPLDVVPDPPLRPVTFQTEQLLIHCAEAIDRGDLNGAHRLMQVLNTMVSPHGTAEQRMAYYFLEGLAARIVGTGSAIYRALQSNSGSDPGSGSKEMLAALLAFLEACPYANFGHVAANGAILEAFEGESHLHIIDFGITHGTQWPVLIESLAMRPGGVPHLRITAVDAPQTGLKPSSIQEVGRRLTNFAKLMGIPFEFRSVTEHLESLQPEHFALRPGEALAVNCVLRLHQIPDENRTLDQPSPRNQTLRMVRSLQPKIVTLVEQHTDHNLHRFTARFREAIHYYNALFDSLAMSLPWHSTERVLIEERVLGRKIVNIIACEGRERIERHESFERWAYRMRRAGFEALPLSEDVVDNIQSLLKRYREGYGLDLDTMSVMLTWRGQRLLAASTWRCGEING